MKHPITVERIERRSIHDLIANPQNARLHSEEQIRQIAASIAEFGFVNPVDGELQNWPKAMWGNVE